MGGPTAWSSTAALEHLARKEFAEKFGSCPNCGAPPEFDVVRVSLSTPVFIPCAAQCSARCWEHQPGRLPGSDRTDMHMIGRPTVDLYKVRGAVARLMTEQHPDWQDVWEQELAELLGVKQGLDPWTWGWEQHTLEGLVAVAGSTDGIL